MSTEKFDSSEHIVFSASFEDWERLIRSIDRRSLTDLVKHDKHLQQHEFRGFRPTHLPWERVPSAIAKHVQECASSRNFLLKTWRTPDNRELCNKVNAEVSVDAIEESIINLLAEMHNTEKSRDKLLWALILDEREAIQQALANGLRSELSDETSSLLSKVQKRKQDKEFEQVKYNIQSLKAELDQTKEQNKQIALLQAQIEIYHSDTKKADAQHQEEIKRRDTLLQGMKEERDNAQQKLKEALQAISDLKKELGNEQFKSSELQQRLNNLQGSLDTIISTQLENSSSVKYQLGEALQQLEAERKIITNLRQSETDLKLSIMKVEQEKIEVYEQWDDEQRRRKELELSLEQAEVAKESAISETRKVLSELDRVKIERDEAHQNVVSSQEMISSLTTKEEKLELALDSMQLELEDVRRVLAEKEKDLQEVVPLWEKDNAWGIAIDNISHHLTLPKRSAIPQLSLGTEKWSDWQSWLELEKSFVRPLLTPSQALGGAELHDAELAQKLLALRWYLLEWFKLSLIDSLRTNNYAAEAKEMGR